MKGAVFNQVGSPLTVESLPVPAPGDGEVLIRVERCGICGSDLHLSGDAVFGLPAGTVLGHEISGVVIDTGNGVERCRVGDRVCILPVRSCGHCATCLAGDPVWCAEKLDTAGGYAEFAVAHERQCLRLPSIVSDADAALVEPLAVGLHGVRLSGLRPHAKVVVIGAGPIGLATAYWARQLGAGRVAMTATSLNRADLALGMGATDFLAPDQTAPDVIATLLGGAPDIVFECVGRPGLIERSIALVRARGTVVGLGLCPHRDHYDPVTAIMKEVRIQMSAYYNLGDFEASIDVFDAGRAEPSAMITDTVGLDAVPEMFEALRTRSSQCKVQIMPHGTVSAGN